MSDTCPHTRQGAGWAAWPGKVAGRERGLGRGARLPLTALQFLLVWGPGCRVLLRIRGEGEETKSTKTPAAAERVPWPSSEPRLLAVRLLSLEAPAGPWPARCPRALGYLARVRVLLRLSLWVRRCGTGENPRGWLFLL